MTILIPIRIQYCFFHNSSNSNKLFQKTEPIRKEHLTLLHRKYSMHARAQQCRIHNSHTCKNKHACLRGELLCMRRYTFYSVKVLHSSVLCMRAKFVVYLVV